MVFEYPYKRYPCDVDDYSPDGHNSFPIVPADFEYQGNDHRLGVLVDTGASHTTLPFSAAQAFGLDPTTGTQITTKGADGDLIVFGHLGFSVTVAGVQFNVPVLFSEHLHIPLLGRHAIFDHFNVTFDQERWMVCFEPRGDLIVP